MVSWRLYLCIWGQEERELERVALAGCLACSREPQLWEEAGVHSCYGWVGPSVREGAFCGLSTSACHPRQVWANSKGIIWAADPSHWVSPPAPCQVLT